MSAIPNLGTSVCINEYSKCCVVFCSDALQDLELGHPFPQLTAQPPPGNCPMPKEAASPKDITFSHLPPTPQSCQEQLTCNSVHAGMQSLSPLASIWNISKGPPQFQCSLWVQLGSLATKSQFNVSFCPVLPPLQARSQGTIQ